jgi:hypothetical protein
VERIEFQTFGYCKALKAVSIPDSVKLIGDSAFENCLSLQSITVPGSVLQIDGGAFFNCTSLAVAVLNVDRPTLGMFAFPPWTRIVTDISSATVSGLSASYAYTGSAVMPKPRVWIVGRTVPLHVLDPADYTLSYANNTAVGKATIIIEGRNGCGGTVTKNFSIARTKAALSRSTSWTRLTRGKTYYAKGLISPRHSTTDKNTVKIRAYKKRSDGKYHYVQSFTAKYSYYSSTKTRYTAAVNLKSRGTWKLVAYHAADSRNIATFGSADYVVVR